jgi:hypothetical protein
MLLKQNNILFYNKALRPVVTLQDNRNETFVLLSSQNDSMSCRV